MSRVRVGITGGIGSGKSYVSARLRRMGFGVYDCDAEAKSLMVRDAALVAALKALVGDDAYSRCDGGWELNKPVLRRYVFADAAHAAAVGGIVHPAVRRDLSQWFASQPADIAFMESAILFGAHFEDLVDVVLCVSAPLDVRLSRIMTRDGVDEPVAHARMECQSSDEFLRAHSDFMIWNDGRTDLDETLTQILRQISQSSQSNVNHIHSC